MTIHYGLVGAGGHGRDSMPIVRQQFEKDVEAQEAKIYFVVESQYMRSNLDINGYQVISLDNFKNLSGDKRFNVAIADSLTRERISQECEQSGMKPFNMMASNCVVFDEVRIGDGYILSPFTTITSNIKIGIYFHANINSYIAHDCLIGDYVTFAPNVGCNGNVVIGDHVYIGTGAVIKQGVTIGDHAVVGMGAVVIDDVSSHTTVVGNPARKMVKYEG